MNGFIDTDHERELWIMNDESLYHWWRSTRLSMRKFIKIYKDDINRAIKERLGRT